MGESGQDVERELDIYRSKRGVVQEGDDTNCGLWFWNLLITYIREKKDEVLKMICFKNMCVIRKKGQSEKLVNKRSADES